MAGARLADPSGEIQLLQKELTDVQDRLSGERKQIEVLGLENARKLLQLAELEAEMERMKERYIAGVAMLADEQHSTGSSLAHEALVLREHLQQLHHQRLAYDKTAAEVKQMKEDIDRVLSKMAQDALAHAELKHGVKKELLELRKQLETAFRKALREMDGSYTLHAFDALTEPEKQALLINNKLRDELALQDVGLRSLCMRQETQRADEARIGTALAELNEATDSKNAELARLQKEKWLAELKLQGLRGEVSRLRQEQEDMRHQLQKEGVETTEVEELEGRLDEHAQRLTNIGLVRDAWAARHKEMGALFCAMEQLATLHQGEASEEDVDGEEETAYGGGSQDTLDLLDASYLTSLSSERDRYGLTASAPAATGGGGGGVGSGGRRRRRGAVEGPGSRWRRAATALVTRWQAEDDEMAGDQEMDDHTRELMRGTMDACMASRSNGGGGDGEEGVGRRCRRRKGGTGGLRASSSAPCLPWGLGHVGMDGVKADANGAAKERRKVNKGNPGCEGVSPTIKKGVEGSSSTERQDAPEPAYCRPSAAPPPLSRPPSPIATRPRKRHLDQHGNHNHRPPGGALRKSASLPSIDARAGASNSKRTHKHKISDDDVYEVDFGPVTSTTLAAASCLGDTKCSSSSSMALRAAAKAAFSSTPGTSTGSAVDLLATRKQYERRMRGILLGRQKDLTMPQRNREPLRQEHLTMTSPTALPPDW